MVKRSYQNRLNNLSPKEWIKFQKSWFVHNPPPRNEDVLLHPAKFPETLVKEFVEFFTKEEQLVLDPMVGTGSTLVATLRSRRHGYGIELNPQYTDIAQRLIQNERNELGMPAKGVIARVIQGDARKINAILEKNRIYEIDYVITSPPYWDMLHARGADTQQSRRQDSEKDVIYSENANDLGNIHNYKDFLESLFQIFIKLKPFLKPRAYVTIIVKNIKKGGKIYPLAWDLGKGLSDILELKDEKIWCQDNQRLFPYGMGSAWVSNTFHHYCLQFRNE
jgi:DNA modification methylase